VKRSGIDAIATLSELFLTESTRPTLASPVGEAINALDRVTPDPMPSGPTADSMSLAGLAIGEYLKQLIGDAPDDGLPSVARPSYRQ
jgi:hypothetical protein